MEKDEDLRRQIRANNKLRRLRSRTPRCRQCGEEREAALIRQSSDIICCQCFAIKRRLRGVEEHHVAGRRNDPFTVALPANDHCCATDRQNGWPRSTLRNLNNSPLLKNAAWARGLRDLFLIWAEYLSQRALFFEQVNLLFEKRFGSDVWERIARSDAKENSDND